jgi:hypothetical protein
MPCNLLAAQSLCNCQNAASQSAREPLLEQVTVGTHVRRYSSRWNTVLFHRIGFYSETVLALKAVSAGLRKAASWPVLSAERPHLIKVMAILSYKERSMALHKVADKPRQGMYGLVE